MGTKTRIAFIAVVLIAAGCLVPGCAGTGPVRTDDEAGIAANIVYDLPDSAQITKVAYFIKPYKGADRLHIEVALKNISTETKRFRVNIFLPEGPSGGGLYPRKVNDQVQGIAAGEEHSVAFPMYFDRLPSGFSIIVKEI